MKRKNAFTLIELLAIIVILAIIAVITVPIILNIIENAKKGAAQDSAYGYKDAINKWYVQELTEDSTKRLNGTYTISNGKLNNIDIPLSGDKPTNGTLTYSNNILTGGCLTIGDYKVTFDTKGSISETIKGECDVTPTIASCPGCKFIYTKSTYAIEGSSADNNYSTDMPTEQDGLTDNYTELTSGENSHPYFLGLIESTTNPGKIGRAFACGIENDTPFCLEGTLNGSAFNANKTLLTDIYGEYNSKTNLGGCMKDRYESWQCNGTLSVYAFGGTEDYVFVGTKYDTYDNQCYVDSNILGCNS